MEKKEKSLLANSMLFFCEDEVTSSKTLILTALLLEYKMFDLFNEKSSEFLRIEQGIDLDVKIYPKNNHVRVDGQVKSKNNQIAELDNLKSIFDLR